MTIKLKEKKQKYVSDYTNSCMFICITFICISDLSCCSSVHFCILPQGGGRVCRFRNLFWWLCRLRQSQKSGVYLGTGIYLSFLEFRSATSRYADVIGGVTSEWQRSKHLQTNYNSSLNLFMTIYMIWTPTFRVDLFHWHFAGWNGSNHLIGWEQTDTVLPFGCAALKPALEEHVSPTFTALHRC